MPSPLWLLAGIAELPDLVPRHIAMGLALVEEEGGVAEGAVVTEGTAELTKAGVLAVLMAQQGLLVAALVAHTSGTCPGASACGCLADQPGGSDRSTGYTGI